MELLVFLLLALFVFIVVIPIVLLARTSSLNQRLESLEREMRRIGRTETQDQEQPQQTPRLSWSEWLARQHAEPAEPTPEETASAAEWTRPPPAQEPGQITTPPEPEEAPAPPSQPPASSEQDLEILIGGTVFNRIAAVAIVMGVGFFLQVAFAKGWISPWTRVALGFGVGCGLLAIGHRFHEKGARIFAQGLIGAGIAILYLSAYASFKSYQLVSQTVAFVLMSCVTAVAIAVSLRYDALVISLLGLIGGFLTPILLAHTGVPENWSALFIYIALLDLGLLAVAAKKDNWTVIEPLALLGTYATYAVWHLDYYDPTLTRLALGFVTVFWALFFVADLLRTMRATPTSREVRTGVAVVNSIAYYLALHWELSHHFPAWSGLATLLLGIAYCIPVVLLMRNREDRTLFVPRSLVTAIALLVIATAIQFREQAYVVVSLWSVEALALLWVGVRRRVPTVTYCAALLFGVAVIGLVTRGNAFVYGPIAGFAPIINYRALAFAVIAACMAAAAFVLRRSQSEEEQSACLMFDLGWSWLVFILIGVEVSDYYRKLMTEGSVGTARMHYSTLRPLMMGLAWLAYSVPLVWVGVRRQVLHVSASGLAMAVVGTVAVAGWSTAYAPIASYVPLVNIRSASLLLAMAVLLAHFRILLVRENTPNWFGYAREALCAAIALFGFELVTVEVTDYFRALADQQYVIDPAVVRALVLTLAWTALSLVVSRIGATRRSQVLAVLGLSMMALASCVAAIQAFDFRAEASTPLFNVRGLTLAAIAAGLCIHGVLVRRAFDESDWLRDIARSLPVAAALVLFELVSLETWDGFGARAAVLGGGTVQLRQLMLSVSWLAYSILLMGYGIWRRAKTLRYVSILIYLVTVAKVFLYDLAALDTLYRTFSFIGLGLILMATSYLYQRYRDVIAQPKNGNLTT